MPEGAQRGNLRIVRIWIEPRIRLELIGIVKPGQTSAFASDVTNFEGNSARKLLLNIEVPFPGVRSRKITRRDEDTHRPSRNWPKNRTRHRTVKGILVVIEADYWLRAERISSQACGICEICNQQILRDVVVIYAISCTDNGALKRVPRDTDTRGKIVQVAPVGAVQSTTTHRLQQSSCEIRGRRECVPREIR